jgi:hypothetical protein
MLAARQQRAFRAMAAGQSRSVVVRVTAGESRIGSKPVPVPKGVTVTIDGMTLKVKVRRRLCSSPLRFGPHAGVPGYHAGPIHNLRAQGPLGTLEQTFTPYVKLEQVRALQCRGTDCGAVRSEPASKALARRRHSKQ